MIFVALALIGFGVGDLLRWSPEAVSAGRATGSALGAAAVVAATAGLFGMSASQVAVAAAVASPILFAWLAVDCPADVNARYPLLGMLVVLVSLLALSGSAPRPDGELGVWLAALDVPAFADLEADQFALAVGAALFLLATANRIVRMLLSETDAPAGTGEGALRGGRLLGPMERLVIAAAVVSGQLAVAGFVVAAKGLLRFPEIRAQSDAQIDEVTEYFLIGTFTSVVVAAIVALFVLGSF